MTDGRPAPPPLRRQQAEALDALDAAWRAGRDAAWVVLPPGGGKTRLGLEAVQRIGRPAVVFGPNTAIQGQWLAQADALGIPAGTDRGITASVTVLTYQSLAVFSDTDDGPVETQPGDPPATDDGVVDDGTGTARPGHLERLHPNAVALVDRLATAGPLTLVLDECHHLLEVWGELLAEVLERLPDARVVALTATPPQALSADEAALVASLFGPVVYAASIPGFVRDGYLAPFRELVRFADPTDGEAAYLGRTAARFAQLRSDLMTPGITSTGFLDWLDRRFVQRGSDLDTATAAGGDTAPTPPRDAPLVAWRTLARQDPRLADAVLRAAHAGLLAVPPGAVLHEPHRAPLDADDWVLLLDDFVVGSLLPSSDPRDQAVVEGIREALPGIGYRLTRHGIARGTAPADRVVARSAGKALVTVRIADAELAVRGDGLRLLVLCDFERASAEVPEGLVGVIAPEEGSARGVLRRLVADPVTAGLRPVLVSGAAVACGAALLPELVAWLRATDPGLQLDDPPAVADPDPDALVDVTGTWSSRDWVPLLTRWLDSGPGRILVGTRALLGEGWDARCVNVLVDLTTATTPMAVTQTRGRALRIDPADPEKVAHNWTVCCVADGHPLGDRDYHRLVRKHRGFYAVTADGLVTDGIAHVHPELSPYAAPDAATRARIDAEMLAVAADPDRTRELWRIGTAYDDVPVPEVRVRASRSLGVDLRSLAAGPGAAAAVTGYRLVGGTAGEALLQPRFWASLRDWVRAGADATDPAEQQARVLEAFAGALADALGAAGDIAVDASAVRLAPTGTGGYRIWLDGAAEDAASLFADALDEILSPLDGARYVVPRVTVPVPSTKEERRRLAWARLRHRPVPVLVSWHAVPSVLAANKQRAEVFATAWNRWVSPGQAVYTGSVEGAGILAAQRGDDPLRLETAMRTEWR